MFIFKGLLNICTVGPNDKLPTVITCLLTQESALHNASAIFVPMENNKDLHVSFLRKSSFRWVDFLNKCPALLAGDLSRF